MLRVELASLLRGLGRDVVRTEETGQARADDALVLQRAVQEERTLVTIDGHFGDWVVLPLSEHYGVIRVDVHPTSTANRSQADFRNKLVIVSPRRVRWIKTKDE